MKSLAFLTFGFCIFGSTNELTNKPSPIARVLERVLVAYFYLLVLFSITDAGWLSIMANILNRPVLSDILLSSLRSGPAIVFYLAYPVGVVLSPLFRAFARIPSSQRFCWRCCTARSRMRLTTRPITPRWETGRCKLLLSIFARARRHRGFPRQRPFS